LANYRGDDGWLVHAHEPLKPDKENGWAEHISNRSNSVLRQPW
jgi:hypothetical protein